MKNSNSIKEIDKEISLFPWSPSWGKINFMAFNYTTIDFFNELYGYLMEILDFSNFRSFDKFLNKKHHVELNKEWIPERNGNTQQGQKVSLITFIRHKVHHPENKTIQIINYPLEELRESIEKIIKIMRKVKGKQKTFK